MSYLGKHAEYYDLFYRDKPYREEADYVAGLIRHRSVTAKTILDLGCGTGLRCLELARIGYQVSGLDRSPAMLELARQHLSEATDIPASAVQFLTGEVTSFRATDPVDAVISLFHVFSYLTTTEALRQAVECAFANLNSGGVFLFDYWHGPGVLKDPPAFRKKVAENGALHVVRTSVPTHFTEQHLVELRLSLHLTEKPTMTSYDVEESYTLRYWFLDELERALRISGFKDIQHYAWMTERAPAPESWQAVTIALKP
jgi:SAM-dependent methyltransferase